MTSGFALLFGETFSSCKIYLPISPFPFVRNEESESILVAASTCFDSIFLPLVSPQAQEMCLVLGERESVSEEHALLPPTGNRPYLVPF